MAEPDDQQMSSRPVLHGTTWEQVVSRLDRIEDKLDKRMSTLDGKVDGLTSRQDRLEGKLDGTLGMIRWLGPSGIAALLFGVAKSTGII